MALEKPIEQLAEADLLDLISSSVSERRTIEYKLASPHTNDEAKKEFLADVSSFANAAGGHLVYGMNEKEGMPISLAGLTIANPDQEKLRLENMIRTGISPRLPGVELSEPIPLSTGGSAFVIRVPRSWISPHMVTLGGHSKFYSRNSAGKYRLDVDELRSAFAFSQATKEKMRDFRADRLSKIMAGEGPYRMAKGSLAILHVMPLSAFETDRRFDAHELARALGHTPPIYRDVIGGTRYNFDGYVALELMSADSAVAYLQAFRTGILESVDVSLLYSSGVIPSLPFEGKLLKGHLPRYLLILKQLGVPPPIFFGLSLLGVSGLTMGMSHIPATFRDIPGFHSKIRENNLILPEVMAETYDANLDLLFRPVFDAIWNAADKPKSPYYDGDVWVGETL